MLKKEATKLKALEIANKLANMVQPIDETEIGNILRSAYEELTGKKLKENRAEDN